MAATAPEFVAVTEGRFRELEVDAVATAPTTPGLSAALPALVDTGRTVTIVSNNSQAAVQTFIDTHDLAHGVHGVVARTDSNPRLLKPSPHLVLTAMRQLGARPGECALIGDSTTDVTAAHAAGTIAIGYANKPGKRERLTAAGANAIIDRLGDLARASAISTQR